MALGLARCGAVALLACGFIAACLAGEGAAPPSAIRLERWIRQLDDDDFHVRELASKSLLEAGKAAIGAVASAAESESLEPAVRAVRILDQLASSPDPGASRAALKA